MKKPLEYYGTLEENIGKINETYQTMDDCLTAKSWRQAREAAENLATYANNIKIIVGVINRTAKKYDI